MKFKQLTITEEEFGFTVTAAGHVAKHLGRDETLGCIASALFTAEMPMYMKTLEEQAAWEARYAVAVRADVKA
jgi:hypothetical protein